jgi:S-adenosylmethionine:tRNA ribosyltransferase-isomerase
VEVSEFDYELPAELIAQTAAEPRDASRLMVVERATGAISHRHFRDLAELLDARDVLVRNVSRVIPARLLGIRERTGGKWEGLYVGGPPGGPWEFLVKTGGHPAAGERVVLDRGGVLVLEERLASGRWLARPEGGVEMLGFLEAYGHIPIPPYIRKGMDEPGDRARYQTVYAREPGSVAAPTAGLHFTPGLIERLRDGGVVFEDVLLHVGPGTFRPMGEGPVEAHVVEAEWGEVTPECAGRLEAHRARGGRIVAVGTTTCRVLESAGRGGRGIEPWRGLTELFIRPGHVFRVVDALVTNFHLPRSSLLVLVSALAGRELIRRAYEEALRERYRFYSYGDAMLIL